MKKITKNTIKEILNGGSNKQVDAIYTLLQLQITSIEKQSKEESSILVKKEAEAIEAIKNKFSEKKDSVEDTILRKVIYEIVQKNSIVIEKDSVSKNISDPENKFEELKTWTDEQDEQKLEAWSNEEMNIQHEESTGIEEAIEIKNDNHEHSVWNRN